MTKKEARKAKKEAKRIQKETEKAQKEQRKAEERARKAERKLRRKLERKRKLRKAFRLILLTFVSLNILLFVLLGVSELIAMELGRGSVTVGIIKVIQRRAVEREVISEGQSEIFSEILRLSSKLVSNSSEKGLEDDVSTLDCDNVASINSDDDSSDFDDNDDFVDDGGGDDDDRGGIHDDDVEEDDEPEDSGGGDPGDDSSESEVTVDILSERTQEWMVGSAYNLSQVTDESIAQGITENPGFISTDSYAYQNYIASLFSNNYTGKSVYGISYENAEEGQLVIILFEYNTRSDLQANESSINFDLLQANPLYGIDLLGMGRFLILINDSSNSDAYSNIIDKYKEIGFESKL